MANDRDRNDATTGDIDDAAEGSKGRKRTIGKGMDSLDSTQAPLKSETGEPDYEAMTGKGKGKERDDQSA